MSLAADGVTAAGVAAERLPAPPGRVRSIGPLAYLELRLARNRLRALAHNPVRLVAWVLFAGYVIILLPARLARGGHVSAGDFPVSPVGLAVAATPGVVLAIIGAVLMASGRRPPGVFSSPAEARFLAGSALSPRLVVGWLQLRALVGMAVRLLTPVTFSVAVLPAAFQVRPGAAALATLGAVLLLAAILSARLPVFVASRRGPSAAGPAAGALLVAVGALAALVGVAADPAFDLGVPAGWAHLVAAIPPGSLLVAEAHGNLAALAALAVLAVTSGWLAVRVGGDCYPELWDATRRRYALRSLARRRGGLFSSEERRRALREAGTPLRELRTVRSASASLAPMGASIVIWKEWLAVLRAPGGVPLLAMRLLVALAAGVALGVLDGRGPRGAAAGVAVLVGSQVLMASVMSPVQLGDDLRAPLWWLSAAPLRRRLAAWSLGSTIRQTLTLLCGTIGALLAAGQPLLAVGTIPVLVVICWLLRCMALAMYAIVPAGMDMRGPGALLRVLCFAAMVVPLAVVALPLMALMVDWPFVVLALLAGAVLEGLGLVRLAAHRLQANGIAVAQMERA